MKAACHFLNEPPGRYAANNFNAVMAKNAKLTIVEANTFFSINDFVLGLMTLITPRLRTSFLLAQFHLILSTYREYMSIVSCKQPRKNK